MAFDKKFTIDVMYPLANAAYLVMNVPTPTLSLPVGFALAGLIEANSADAAAAMSVADPDHQRLANIMVSESSIFGLVGGMPQRELPSSQSGGQRPFGTGSRT